MPGKPGRPRKEPVAVVVDDPGIEFEVLPAQEPHPADVSAEAARVAIEQSPPIEVDMTQTRALAQPDREASREARKETRDGTGRKERKPLGVSVQRLQADVPSGMTGRWMNDTPGRIQRALDGGYEFISSDGEVVKNRDGGRSEIVGTGRDGGAMKAFLMAIPTVYYDKDQAVKASKIKEFEDDIKRGQPHQAAAEDVKSFYTPSEGINIRTNTTAER